MKEQRPEHKIFVLQHQQPHGSWSCREQPLNHPVCTTIVIPSRTSSTLDKCGKPREIYSSWIKDNNFIKESGGGKRSKLSIPNNNMINVSFLPENIMFCQFQFKTAFLPPTRTCLAWTAQLVIQYFWCGVCTMSSLVSGSYSGYGGVNDGGNFDPQRIVPAPVNNWRIDTPVIASCCLSPATSLVPDQDHSEMQLNIN